ncbi:MAG: integrase core domain-containing protein [Actinomycetota bacterium]|nr:integrase core domain-containing protein [Actinomycetota bacterium]
MWGYDVTHFTRAKRAVIAIIDLVSRKWIDHLLCTEETSTQVAAVFTRALDLEGLLDAALARTADGTVPVTVDDERRPILLAVSDNGPQMTSGSTREFMALHAIATHYGRPGTPTDQAGIETLFGHVKVEWPHLTIIRDPAELDRQLTRVRADYNGVRLHAGIGYVTPNDEHEGRGPAIRRARRDGMTWAAQTKNLLPSQATTKRPVMTPRTCCVTTPPKADIESDTRQCAVADHRRAIGRPTRRRGSSR